MVIHDGWGFQSFSSFKSIQPRIKACLNTRVARPCPHLLLDLWRLVRSHSQVEAEYGVSSFPATVKKDPLLIALEARIQVLRSEKGESRWIAMARRSVEITSTRVLGSPIVTNLDTDNVSQLLASDESHIAQLLALHGAGRAP